MTRIVSHLWPSLLSPFPATLENHNCRQDKACRAKPNTLPANNHIEVDSEMLLSPKSSRDELVEPDEFASSAGL